MMMMTIMISVELEGVFTHTQTQTESGLDCVLEKKAPQQQQQHTWFISWLLSLLARLPTEEISSLC